MQMNSLIPSKIDVQIQNAGIQLLNLGIQTLIIYKQISIFSTEEENQFNQNIDNIRQQMKNLFFPENINPMCNCIGNMGNIGDMRNDMMNTGMMNTGMMNQGMMNPGMMNQGMINPGMMNQGMMKPMLIGDVMNPLNMNNNLMNNQNDCTTGMSNPIFKIMADQLGPNESQDPLLKEIKIIFKRMNGQEKTKYYSYFKTKVCDMLRDYIMEENLKRETTFLFNGNKLSKLNQNYICDILNDNSVILVLA